MAFAIGEISASVTADQSGFNASMNDVRKRGATVAKDVQKQFRQVGRRMQSIGMTMSAALTAPLVGVGGFALKTAADFESLRQSMDILNGSAEEGARNFERLKEFSAGTPFQLRGLAEAQNMLQGFGLSADEAFESISMIGDIAAVSGGDIKGIGIAFGQAAAEGRLMTRDIRQLINQGVPAIKLLADTMGVAQSEVLDLASQGEISFEILQQAFQDATTEGGMFANGMAKQAKTLRGIFSTLKDNIAIAMNEIGQSISETFDIKGLAEGLISQIQTGIDWFNELSDETRRMAFTMAGVLGASGPIIAALGTLSVAIGAISAPIAGAAAAVGAASALIISNWSEVESYFTTGGGAQMWTELKEIVDNTVTLVSALWDTFGDDIIKTTKGSFGVVLTVIETTLKQVNNIVGFWADVFTGQFNEAFGEVEGGFKDMASGLISIATTDLGNWGWFINPAQKAASLGASIFSSAEEESSEAAKKMRENLEKIRAPSTPKDPVIPVDIDVSTSGMDLGEKIQLFPDRGEAIGEVTNKVSQLGTAVSQGVTTKMGQLRKTSWNATTVMTEGMSLAQIAIEGVRDRSKQAAQAGAQLGRAIGSAFSKAALHGKNLLDVVGKLVKQLASRVFVQGITALLTGGSSLVARSLGSAIFGGLFHDGGIVPGGQKDRQVRVRPGEGIFTRGQMKALGGMQGSNITQSSMQKAFEKALFNTVTEVAPSRVFELSQKGKRGF